MTESQKQFEAWAARYHGAARIGVFGLIYSNDSVQHDWNVWQASRAAIVVELPEVEGFNDDGVYSTSVELRDVQEALDKAGVSYK